MWVRVTRDGVRQAKVDDEIIEIPHDDEIAAPALAPGAASQAYFVQPQFYSVSVRDMLIADVRMQCAVARDLDSLTRLAVVGAKELLTEAARIVRRSAAKSVDKETLSEIEAQLDHRLAELVRNERSFGADTAGENPVSE